jgi:hypothetical protein
MEFHAWIFLQYRFSIICAYEMLLFWYKIVYESYVDPSCIKTILLACVTV